MWEVERVRLSHMLPHLCGMPLYARAARLLFMLELKSFFDESIKSPEQGPALLMAGFMGRADQWELLSDAWSLELRKTPSIEYFKSTECQSLGDQFLRFDRSMADEKKLSLSKVIARFPTITGFCAAVPHWAFSIEIQRYQRRGRVRMTMDS